MVWSNTDHVSGSLASECQLLCLIRRIEEQIYYKRSRKRCKIKTKKDKKKDGGKKKTNKDVCTKETKKEEEKKKKEKRKKGEKKKKKKKREQVFKLKKIK